jgi:hypothetical protein
LRGGGQNAKDRKGKRDSEASHAFMNVITSPLSVSAASHFREV